MRMRRPGVAVRGPNIHLKRNVPGEDNAMMRSIALIAALLVVATPLRAEIVHVDSAGLQRLLADDVAVVDIRTPEEWSETGTIEGSHLLTFFDANGDYDIGAWLRAVSAIADPGQPVALICHGGKRSFRVARMLDRQPGHRRVYNVRGGVSGWIAEDRPVVAGP